MEKRKPNNAYSVLLLSLKIKYICMYLLVHAENISGNIKKKPGGPWFCDSVELGAGAVLALKIPLVAAAAFSYPLHVLHPV